MIICDLDFVDSINIQSIIGGTSDGSSVSTKLNIIDGYATEVIEVANLNGLINNIDLASDLSSLDGVINSVLA